jgi:polar amino acid transport system ATP-binding protein
MKQLERGRERARGAPLIALRGVRLQLGGREVLAGVDLEIERGEKLVLIGKSGSGKSSILRVLMALDRPTAGDVELDGQRMWTLPSGAPASEAHVRALRSRLGIVFQHFNLFPHMTAQDNVALALKLVKKRAPAQAQQSALEYLAQVGLAERGRAFPVQLSGGQRQRVAIARALAMEPEILLLDEVTSGLDPELIEEVVMTIEGLSTEQRTLVIVTHQRDFARRVATRVARIEAGRVAEAGMPQELLLR